MRQRRITERTSETAGNGDEGERCKDTTRWNDGRHRGIAGSRSVEVDSAYDCGEDGLNGVEKDGEVPDFRGVDRTIGFGGELFLKICPSEAIRDNDVSD
jgi:hypothetical protein